MSSTIDIESKLNTSINDPNFGDIKQFKLYIKTKEKTYSFFKIPKKYCQLINVLDGINFNDIINFELIINNKIINQELINIKHIIDKNNIDEEDCYIYKDSEIYIEFLKKTNLQIVIVILKN